MLDLLDIASWATGAAGAGWIAASLFATYRVLRMPDLGEQSYPVAEPLPSLTVVIPACNEAATLEAAMRSLLAQDYPGLEVVIVDDRSTDETPEIVDRLAAQDDRVTPVHIVELPADWLGKINAMNVGTARASGDWLLFADADVRYEPGALQNAVSFALAGAFDHIALIPDVERPTFLHAILMETFGVALALAVPLHRVPEQNAHFFGVGAFNLVRREALERTEGFEWLRMEIADDMGLGLLLHRHGARTWAGTAPASLKLSWYGSAWEMIRGLEKNLFAALGHLSTTRTLAFGLVMLAALVLPIAGFALPAPFGWPLSLAVPAGLLPLALATAHRWDGSPIPILLLPVGLALLLVALVRSTLSYHRNGGASWRGTTYPTAKLREFQRVKL